MTADPSTSAMSPTPRSNVRRWGFAIVLVPLAVFGIMKGCNLWSDIVYREDVVEMLGGEEIMKTIQEPDRVTAQRIRLKVIDEQTDPEGGFARVNYEPMAEPVEVSDANARRLAAWLTAGSSYVGTFNSTKSCIPSYGVKLSFDRGDRHVEVWLCFECDIFSVYEPIEYESSQASSGGGDFDLIHDELADIMQSLFPDDEAIQAL